MTRSAETGVGHLHDELQNADNQLSPQESDTKIDSDRQQERIDLFHPFREALHKVA
jgi:hypothetical protein